MKRSVTIRDVAQRAGVSMATASRVLSGHESTSPEARHLVRQAAADLHYSPNGLARSLRSSRTRAIGLLVSDIRNPFFSELAYSVQTALFDRGFSMLLGNSSEQDALQDQYLTALMEQRVDGLIAAPQGGGSALLTRIAEHGTPMVFVDRTLPTPRVPFVNSDPEPGIRQALDRLAADGHTRVGFVAGPQNTSTGIERREVFERLASGRFSALVRLGGYEQDQCVDSVNALVDEGCTALLFGYSPNAVSALRVLAGRGIRLPEDLSLVSFDEVPFFELVTPQVSIISQGVVDMGRIAVDMLIDLMSGSTPDDRRLATQLVVRHTNGPAPQPAGRTS